MHIDPTTLSPRAAYTLATSLIVPRPIAWVGTRSPDGIDNIAPFSYFMGVSTRPPSIAISVARGRGGTLKDTARNILSTRVFTVSIVSHFLAEQMVQTSAPLPPETSEFDTASLKPVNGSLVAAPRPTQALASMECSLVHQHDMETTHLLVGEVLRYHLDDTIVFTNDRGHAEIDISKLDAIGRLGGSRYCRIVDPFDLP